MGSELMSEQFRSLNWLMRKAWRGSQSPEGRTMFLFHSSEAEQSLFILISAPEVQLHFSTILVKLCVLSFY